MEKSGKKFAPKASLRLIFYFGKQHARNYFKNKIF